MAWGEIHEIPYDSKVQERILGPFSLGQLVWLLPSAILSFQLSKHIPKLPFDSMIFSRLHWLIPLAIGIVFAYFKNTKTNQSLFEVILTKISLKRRNRIFTYKRFNQIYPQSTSQAKITDQIEDENDR